MPETEKDAYVSANGAFREAQQNRMSLADAVYHAELAVRNVDMGANSSLVLISAAQGFLTTLKVALAEAVEAEEEAAKKAKRAYERRCAEQQHWGARPEDVFSQKGNRQ